MRPVAAAERPGLAAWLARDRPGAMFSLAELDAIRLWRGERAVLGLSAAGMAMPVLRGPVPGAALRGALSGARVRGVVGPAADVRALCAACDLPDAREMPQFLLDLAALAVPEGSGVLAPLSRDPALAARWRGAYEAELDTGTGRDPAESVAAWIAADSARFLVVEGAPVAMTGFNAVLPEIVQVGGVYVPPEARRRGHAGRAVALHLAEARGRGVRQATLFAASEGAARCYAPLGFGRIGTVGLAFYRPAREVA